jgi:hypothetical protein
LLGALVVMAIESAAAAAGSANGLLGATTAGVGVAAGATSAAFVGAATSSISICRSPTDDSTAAPGSSSDGAPAPAVDDIVPPVHGLRRTTPNENGRASEWEQSKRESAKNFP